MAKLRIDLHAIYNKGGEIESAIDHIVHDAVKKGIPLIEIITGKGSGQLKKHVCKYLDEPKLKSLYFRLQKDSKNYGRIFVEFRHKKANAYHG